MEIIQEEEYSDSDEYSCHSLTLSETKILDENDLEEHWSSEFQTEV